MVGKLQAKIKIWIFKYSLPPQYTYFFNVYILNMDFKFGFVFIKYKRIHVNIWGVSQICLQKMGNIFLFDDKKLQTSIFEGIFYSSSVSSLSGRQK